MGRIREKILRKAFMLFSKRGFDGTRMADIASAVGINKATIYYYFESKKALYQEVLYLHMSRFYSQVMEVVDRLEGTPKEMIEQLVDIYFDFFTQNRELWRLYLREVCDGGKYLRGVIERLREENPLLREGAVPARLDKMSIPSKVGTTGLHLWLHILGMIFVHFLFYPFIEEVSGIRVDEAFVESRKREVLKFLNEVLW